jgi:hypothetical protein
MRMTINGAGVGLDTSLLDYLERRLRFALGRFAPRIRRVTMRIADLNGPKGGVDERCAVHITLHPAHEVFVAHADRDVRVAADLAAERAASAVGREIARRRAWRSDRPRLNGWRNGR